MQIPNELKQAIENDNLIIWVGAGYCLDFGFPNWETLIKDLGEEYNKISNTTIDIVEFENQLKQNDADYLQILDLLKDKKKELLKKLPNHFKSDVRESDSKLDKFRNLWKLSNKIITTNYDENLDFVRNHTNIKVIKWNDEHKSNLNISKGNYLYKIHGCISSPENCVLFKEEYDKVYVTNFDEGIAKETPHLLGNLITNYNILFLGFGGFKNDIHISFLLDYNKRILKTNSPKHFIFSKNKDLAKIEKYDFLQPIEVSDYPEINEHVISLIKIKPSTTYKVESIGSFLSYEGRKDEVDDLITFLSPINSCKFLFIWGPGGMGKSSLLKHCLNDLGLNKLDDYLYFKIKAETTLRSLARQLNLKITIDDSHNGSCADFIKQVNNIDKIIIIDDFYETSSEDKKLINTLIELKESKRYKRIIISRADESCFDSMNFIQVKPLSDAQHESLVNNYASYKNVPVNKSTIDKIYRISSGYPLIAQIIVEILGSKFYKKSFDIENYQFFDFNEYNDTYKKTYIGQLINVVLNGNPDTKEFILNFSLAKKSIPRELFFQIPGFKEISEAERKIQFIDEEDDSFSIHPLIWELLRREAGNRPKVEEIFGNYYLKEFQDDWDNIETYNMAEYHFGRSEGLQEFQEAIQQLLDVSSHSSIINENIKSSIKRLEIVLSNNRNDVNLYNILAQQYMLIGKNKDAIKIINKGLAVDDIGEQNPLLLSTKYLLYKEQGIAGIHAAKEISSLLPNNKHIMLSQAKHLIDSKEFTRAKTKLVELLELHPNFAFAKLYLGIAYCKLGAKIKKDRYTKSKNYEKSEFYLKPFAEKEQMHSLNALGITYKFWSQNENLNMANKKKYFEKAEDLFIKAIQKYDHLQSKTALAQMYREKAQDDNKLSPSDKVNLLKQSENILLDLEEKNYYVYNEFGQLYKYWNTIVNTDDSMLDKAIESYKKAISLRKNNIQSYDGLCRIYLETKKMKDCIYWAKQGLNQKKDDKRLKRILTQTQEPH